MYSMKLTVFHHQLSKQNLINSNTTHWHNRWRWCTTNKTASTRNTIQSFMHI